MKTLMRPELSITKNPYDLSSHVLYGFVQNRFLLPSYCPLRRAFDDDGWINMRDCGSVTYIRAGGYNRAIGTTTILMCIRGDEFSHVIAADTALPNWRSLDTTTLRDFCILTFDILVFR